MDNYVVIERWKLKQLYELAGHKDRADEYVNSNTITAKKLWNMARLRIWDASRNNLAYGYKTITDFLTTKFPSND